MPYGYALLVLVAALATSIVVCSPALNEMPQLLFYLLLAGTVLTVRDGGELSPAGWATVGIGVLTLVGLAVLFQRGLRAAKLVERRHRWPWPRILLAPYYRRRRDVERIADLSYGPGGRRQQLDVYRRRSNPQKAPVFIHFHGGDYSSGRKNTQSLPLIYRLAAQGWVCISANYRLAPDFGFLDHLADAKRVIAWAHAYEGASGPVVVSGSSAGAHLSALCALTQNDPEFQPGFEDADTSLTAAICFGSWLGEYDASLDLPSTPWGYLRPDAPPFLLVHGERDPLARVEDARAFAFELGQVSKNPVQYLELPGGQHGFDRFHSPRCEAVIDAVETFLARRLHPGRVQQDR